MTRVTEDRHMLLAILRSIPPPEMMKVRPQASTAVMAACLRMLKMLSAVKKVSVVGT